MIEFRTATLPELETILDWAAHEGWNPGLDDAAAFHAADPSGFFVACEGDTPVAAISVVNHSDSFAFLGLYIALSSHRGKGIGFGLWQHALAHAGGRTIGLDGVPEQQANYAASGFEWAGTTVRFSGRVTAEAEPEIRLATEADLTDLVTREAAASGTRKETYLHAWFRNTANRMTLIHPDGFATVRACREGAKIGPLVASDTEAARQLLRHAASLCGEAIMIDVPESAVGLTRLCEDMALEPVFRTARMYLGKQPKAAPDIFAVATLELG